MKLKRALLLLFCGLWMLPVALYAQFMRTDLSVPQQIRLQQRSQLPWQVLLEPVTFGQTAINYRAADQQIRSTQHAERLYHTDLVSSGRKQFGAFLLQGAFSYRHERERDIGWKLGRDVFRQPYYYAAIRPGHWDNDRYALTGNAARYWLEDRLITAFGIDYEVEKLARFNDPRPLINHYALFWTAQLGWRFDGGHQLAVHLHRGQADEDGGVQNYNDSNDSFGRTEYNLITLTGLGSYTLQRRSQYEKPTERMRMGLAWNYEQGNSLFTLEAEYEVEESTFLRRSSGGGGASFENMGVYTVEGVELRAFWERVNWAERRIQWRSTTQWLDGSDLNSRFGGANYFNQSWAQLLERRALSDGHHWMFGLRLQGLSIEDRNASHQYEAIRAAVYAEGDWMLFNKTKSRWHLQPSVAFSAPLHDQWFVGANLQNLHTQYVMYADVYNLQAQLAQIGLGIHYIFAVQEFHVGLGVDTAYRHRLGGEALESASLFVPGDRDIDLQFRIQFFH